jgi:phosphocarrier protein HPr
MKLVELANRYGSTIEASNGTLTVDAKSIMSVMRLAAGKGMMLRITADGDDADEAAEAIVQLVNQGFDELKDEAGTVGGGI